MHSSLLVFRTAISLYVAALDGKYVVPHVHTLASITVCRIVASLVKVEPLQFFSNILRWLLVAIPATWCNSWLSYVQNKLAIAYRTRLTHEVLSQYLGEASQGPAGKVYYKLGRSLSPLSKVVSHLKFGLTANLDDRIKNPDQCVVHFVMSDHPVYHR
jgi:ATP-binding cassette subfamily D (ALD) long-chain fatty acid import protein